jgi:hypothetical protein
VQCISRTTGTNFVSRTVIVASMCKTCSFLPGFVNWSANAKEARLGVQVLEARVDHARVVNIMRKADHLPLVKEYLLAVQKTNLAAVNEAVNELLIDEEDFASLRDSISTYDNFDQISLALKLEKHELTEFRRIAATIYKKNTRWRKAVELAKQDKLYKVRAMSFRRASQVRRSQGRIRCALLSPTLHLVRTPDEDAVLLQNPQNACVTPMS